MGAFLGSPTKEGHIEGGLKARRTSSVRGTDILYSLKSLQSVRLLKRVFRGEVKSGIPEGGMGKKRGAKEGWREKHRCKNSKTIHSALRGPEKNHSRYFIGLKKEGGQRGRRHEREGKAGGLKHHLKTREGKKPGVGGVEGRS